MGEDEYDIIDVQLGQAIRSWADGFRTPGVALEVHGPLEAPGMDPTWIVRFTMPWREAELVLFRGPYAEVMWFDPRDAQPGAHVEGHYHLTPESIIALLETLASDGAVADRR
ncbi:hypothetical protein V6U77_11400 [Micromonospora sp. CPCC 205546]|uniref:hypothetical protein n=1 Tax=Micromonospora sp. CPCC 205546 TaxID=3122397 RepID=UPI002FF31101